MTTELVRSDDLSTWTLEELATVAKQEHELVREGLTQALWHAIRSGEALQVAFDRIEPGQWIAWLKKNVDVIPGTAANYMRIAHYRDQLPPVNGLGIAAAMSYLKGLPERPNRKTARKYDQSVRDEAGRLREQGMTYEAIGALFGASQTTVMMWLDPEFYARRHKISIEATRKARKAKQALALQEKREARAAAAKKAGGGLAEAYSTIRLNQLAIDRAITEATDPDTKVMLQNARGFAIRVESKLVEALGVS